MTTRRICISMPDLSGNESRYAAEAVASTWISSSGAFLDRAEAEFAEACGCDYALGTSSGTTALHLAVAGLGLGPGDEVIVPAMTYVATANAVTYCGAQPVFVDVDPTTWCIDPARIEAAITPKTRGIIPVHLLGHPADMDPILELAVTHGLWVVEDAAEAVFAGYKGRLCGSMGTAAAFSFFGNKVLSCGEGGAVTLNDPTLRRRLTMLRGQGMDPKRRYHFPIVGFNYRMTNVAAAILCAQLERRERIVARRREIVDLYGRELGAIPGISVRQDASWAETSPWLAACLVDRRAFGCDRERLGAVLDQRGVETRPFFEPLHALPPYRAAAQARGTRLPVTDRLAVDGIMLPTHPQLADDDVRFVCECIRDVGRATRTRPRRAAAALRSMATAPAAARRSAA